MESKKVAIVLAALAADSSLRPVPPPPSSGRLRLEPAHQSQSDACRLPITSIRILLRESSPVCPHQVCPLRQAPRLCSRNRPRCLLWHTILPYAIQRVAKRGARVALHSKPWRWSPWGAGRSCDSSSGLAPSYLAVPYSCLDAEAAKRSLCAAFWGFAEEGETHPRKRAREEREDGRNEFSVKVLTLLPLNYLQGVDLYKQNKKENSPKEP